MATDTGRIDVVVGTRPEAIKLAPVLHELRSQGATARLLLTGQHREMVDNLIDTLDLADVETVRLDVMAPRQRLSTLAARVLVAMDEHLTNDRPAAVIVQGDTTSAFGAALAAFHEQIPVAHVEAGLRSGSIDNPFPEEMNRQCISKLATWHFCPTTRAAQNLEDEGVAASSVLVTGNTSIDTLHWIRARGLGQSAFGTNQSGRCRVLVTLHRRENQGEPMRELALALVALTERFDLDVVLPLHLSPAVREVLLPVLADQPSIRLTEPADYIDFVATLADADIAVTDSGGVQEEAPSVDTATLVVRETTERPEAIEAGCARLIGVSAEALKYHLSDLITHPETRRAMTHRGSPFGDGRAAARIVERLLATGPVS